MWSVKLKKTTSNNSSETYNFKVDTQNHLITPQTLGFKVKEFVDILLQASSEQILLDTNAIMINMGSDILSLKSAINVIHSSVISRELNIGSTGKYQISNSQEINLINLVQEGYQDYQNGSNILAQPGTAIEPRTSQATPLITHGQDDTNNQIAGKHVRKIS